MAPGAPIVRFERVGKTFANGVKALDGLDLDARAAILAPNRRPEVMRPDKGAGALQPFDEIDAVSRQGDETHDGPIDLEANEIGIVRQDAGEIVEDEGQGRLRRFLPQRGTCRTLKGGLCPHRRPACRERGFRVGEIAVAPASSAEGREAETSGSDEKSGEASLATSTPRSAMSPPSASISSETPRTPSRASPAVRAATSWRETAKRRRASRSGVSSRRR